MHVNIPAQEIALDSKEIKEQIRKTAEAVIQGYLRVYFRQGQKINGVVQATPGVGTEFIQAEIDKLLTEYQESGKLKSIIEHKFNEALNEAIEKLAAHTANKSVFTEKS